VTRCALTRARRSAVVSVDAFSLHSGRRAAAAARAVRLPQLTAPPAESFHELAGRGDGSLRVMDADTAARTSKEVERLSKIIERDPHSTEILEDVDDLLLTLRGV